MSHAMPKKLVIWWKSHVFILAYIVNIILDWLINKGIITWCFSYWILLVTDYSLNCALSISRVYINVNYTTRNSCPIKEGQWIIMFVLQKYFSAVYHPMSYVHGLVFLLTQSMHHCLETALIKASGLSENEIPYSNHSVRPYFLSYNNSWSYDLSIFFLQIHCNSSINHISFYLCYLETVNTTL
jgi:hypothetical protein